MAVGDTPPGPALIILVSTSLDQGLSLTLRVNTVGEEGKSCAQ